MAESETLDELSFEHYLALASVSLLVQRELRRVWRELSGQPAVTIIQALMELVPGIGDHFGDMTAALAVDFYESAREIADAPGRFVAKAADLPTVGRYESLVRGTLGPLFLEVPDEGTAFTKLDGGLQKLVVTVSRDTVTANSVKDPASGGWKRITGTDGCDFCKMLAAKGAIFKEPTALFASHDHCGCTASPSWGGGKAASVLQYVASTRKRSDADRERLRNYLAKKRAAQAARTDQ